MGLDEHWASRSAIQGRARPLLSADSRASPASPYLQRDGGLQEKRLQAPKAGCPPSSHTGPSSLKTSALRRPRAAAPLSLAQLWTRPTPDGPAEGRSQGLGPLPSSAL